MLNACSRTRIAALLAGMGVVVGLGCGPSAAERLASPDPMERVEAIVRLAEQRNADAIPHLVDLLEDYDEGIRFYAILALRRLSGEDYGYRYYDPESKRLEAVHRWRDALRQGIVSVRTSGAAAASPAGEGR